MKFFLSDDEIEKLAQEMGFKDKEPEQLNLFDPIEYQIPDKDGKQALETTKIIADHFRAKDCNHNWETYSGLFEKFDHCSKCGVKK